MTETNAIPFTQLTDEVINRWADDPNGPVALHLKQKLLPVEGEGGVIFPPTYADIGYNIDTLSDGTKVATIDSVGSQANRMEPIFKSIGFDNKGEELNLLANLVPQIEIELQPKGEDKENHVERRRSLLDLAHRSADAVVQASPKLAELMKPAFMALRNSGDAGLLCTLAPTSLVFGVWDSRGGSGEKRPRLVRSIIRAWGVEQLSSAAQFNSVWKYLDEEHQKALKDEEGKKNRAARSDIGLADAPSTFRKVEKIPQYRNGSPNPECRVLGGVIARGEILREVTINLVALRAIGGTLTNENGSKQRADSEIRRYLLSLALLAATHDQELFLREGCQLRYAGSEVWSQVPRRGEVESIDLTSAVAQTTILNYAQEQAKPFAALWNREQWVHVFDLNAAKNLLLKKDEDAAASAP